MSLPRGSPEAEAAESSGGESMEGATAPREELPTPGRAAKRARIDGIWASMQQAGASGKAAQQGTAYGAASRLESGEIGKGTTLASLCQPIPMAKAAVDPDKHWMKSLGMNHLRDDQGEVVSKKPLDRQAALSALQAVKEAASMTAAKSVGKVHMPGISNFHPAVASAAPCH
mmetsp:Transcript_2698/g.6847  ORF Transcript_2698/g.6847 Transcript_2698/m.6847 type:complete len:172 (-) Transcript_2698:42-557(-)